jgi:ATP-dependent Lhr-like helicase
MPARRAPSSPAPARRRAPTSAAARHADVNARSVADFEAWMAGRGWTPFPFQREVWVEMARGQSGMLHATTGAGKTLAVWLGAVARARVLAAEAAPATAATAATAAPAPVPRGAPPLRVLWLTPMRALAADTLRAITAPLADLEPTWTASIRTGDTPSAERARQDRRWPTALVTTPESLTLMLTRPAALDELATVQCVIVDEWHELIGNKRGVQVQLALARLRRANPGLVVWGASATLGNLEEAMRTLVGPAPCTLVQGRIVKALQIDTLLPPDPGRFSWGGHLGAQMLEPVAAEIASSSTTLVFTNTRSQAEAWYQMLLNAHPEWAGIVALHHGSLAKEARDWVEAGLKAGRLKAVVATSSLDLGVDFLPVERVLQIGSAKGIARLLQRAGRSGHAPGRASRVTLVPTNTLELVEGVAARRAVRAGRIESRHTPDKPLDVLVQHLVTVALGGGFTADALYDEIVTVPAYRDLAREEFDWTLAFVERGGDSLRAYPEYHRVQCIDGTYRVPDRGIARRHRMSVGTIVSDAAMQVKWMTGGTIGTMEESFLARLKPGDCFVFAGRVLEFVRTQDMAAYVRKATRPRGVIPVWGGGRMPLSSELADAVLEVLDDVSRALPSGAAAKELLAGPSIEDGLAGPGARTRPRPARASRARAAATSEAMAATAVTMTLDGTPIGRPATPSSPATSTPSADVAFADPELQAAAPMLTTQLALSHLPGPDRLLVERLKSREGHHLYLYPFAGRNVHIGLAGLLAWRLADGQPNTFSISINDYGLELLAAEPVDLGRLTGGEAFAEDHLMDDILASLNARELAQRRFREIARIAGLVFTGYPGAPKAMRQIQASSSLFFEVFRKYDAGNRLLSQADREVLSQELEIGRLGATLGRLRTVPLDVVELAVPSPFALPLMVERFRERLTTEKLSDRIARLLGQAQVALTPPGRAPQLPQDASILEPLPPLPARKRRGARPRY